MIYDRAFDQPLPDGAWDAGFVRATHDGPTSNDDGFDTGFDAHWKALASKPYPRGAYHFAHPAASPAAEQAARFINKVRSQGFRTGVDLWMLDIEQYGDLNGPALAAWIREFMAACTHALGDRGFLYIGLPYFREHISTGDYSLLHETRWWIPAYGSNNGVNHPLDAMPVVPVIHQFTSNPFDKSVIVDNTRWHDLFVPEVIVHQEFNPPLRVVSSAEFQHPKLGKCFVEIQSDGSAFCTPRNAYLGGMNGDANFKGRTAAQVHGIAEGVKVGYVIVDTKGEAYGPKLPHAPAA